VTDKPITKTPNTVQITVGTISPAEIAAAEKIESIPWELRAKGWSPNSGLPPTFKEVPANTTVCKITRDTFLFKLWEKNVVFI
jgi:hypothetical protein